MRLRTPSLLLLATVLVVGCAGAPGVVLRLTPLDRAPEPKLTPSPEPLCEQPFGAIGIPDCPVEV